MAFFTRVHFFALCGLFLVVVGVSSCAARTPSIVSSNTSKDVCPPQRGGFVCFTKTVRVDVGSAKREVHVALPQGRAPADGWPVVFAFQGSAFPAHLFFQEDFSLPFGAATQAHVTRALLKQGFAVIAPETRGGGYTFWETNAVHLKDEWHRATDHQLMLSLFKGLSEKKWGPLDDRRLFAMGISSGGYMTSRMAVSYPGRFLALAIMAGGYATCSGPVCNLPDVLPRDHPPTLFLHGKQDVVVPAQTMRRYALLLEQSGIRVQRVVQENAGHGWITQAPSAIPRFFQESDALSYQNDFPRFDPNEI